MKVEIGNITSQNEAETIKVLVRALIDDPTKLWFFEDGVQRLYHTTWILEKMTRVLSHFGERYVVNVDSKPVGAALWVPPGAHISYSLMLKHGLIKLPFRTGLKRFFKIIKSMDYADKLQQEVMGGRDIWQLYYLGIDPNHQGHGYGSKVIEPVLKKADSENTAVFLQNFTPENTRFYEKNGFKVIRTHEFAPGILMRCMLREPNEAKETKKLDNRKR